MPRIVMIVTLVGLLAAPVGPTVAADDETATVAPDSTMTAIEQPLSLVMGPPVEQSVAGWREIGRASGMFDDGTSLGLGDLVVVSDRLAALGWTCLPDDGPCHEVVLHSSDGVTWTQAGFPDVQPTINDIAPTPSGSLAVGSARLDDRVRGAIWSTTDGIEWTRAPAPPAKRIKQIVTTGDGTVVLAGSGLWASEDGTEWTRLGQPPADPVAAGPGGFLSWAGGGQELMVPTQLWRSSDGSEWTKVKLPKALQGGPDAFGEIQVFALEDGWILVPKEKAPTSIFTSSDGKRWQRAPRPPGIHGGYIWWMNQIGDEVHASGTLYGPRSALWSWELGEKSGEPDVLLGRSSQSISDPVPWQGGFTATGSDMRCLDETITMWRWEPPRENDDVSAALDPTGAPAPPECWAWGKDLHSWRWAHTSTLLDDGRVLVVGGSGSGDLDTTEVYDPAVGTFGLTGYLLEGRDLTSATLLQDGRVLIAGGTTETDSLATAELYDPATGLFTLTGSRIRAGAPDDTILLADGRVLMVDGSDVEIYDPTSGTFAAVSPMAEVAAGGRLSLLADGRVLVVGSAARKGENAAAEVFDPVLMAFEPRAIDRPLTVGHTLTTLQDGRVLLAGGDGEEDAAHIYDPTTGTFEQVGPLAMPRSGHSAVLLGDGSVLLIGGQGERASPRTIEVYDPDTGTFTESGRMKRPRVWAGATLLDDGRVLISGGLQKPGGNVESSAELYDPVTGKSNFVKRIDHQALVE